MSTTDQLHCGNTLLASLSAADYALLQPHLSRSKLQRAQVLAEIGLPVKMVYFPEGGIASTVVTTPDGGRNEVGLFGRDGMSGVNLLLGSPTSPCESFLQVDGTHALTIDATKFVEIVEAHTGLRNALLRYVQTLLVQTAHTAATNANNTIEQRLSRWLLMCHDRLDGDLVAVTNDFLSIMLGVRRAGVTVALQVLEGEDLIRCERRAVTIVSRNRLEAVAGPAYGPPEAEYRKLVGRLENGAGVGIETAA
jgi:CRP-like cAMP-binding protein